MRAAVAAAVPVASGKDGRVGGAVEFRQRDQHGRLDRPQALRAVGPLAQRLELQRVRRDIRDVEILQHRDGRGVVVVGRAADEAEPGQRDHRVDLRAMLVMEIALDRRACVEATGKGRQDAEAPRLEGADHGVVMRCVGADST